MTVECFPINIHQVVRASASMVAVGMFITRRHAVPMAEFDTICRPSKLRSYVETFRP